MANSATLVDTIPARVQGVGPIYIYKIVIDTINTDLIIREPAAGKRLFIVGLLLSESTATNVTLKSVTTPSGTPATSYTTVLELAASQGVYDKEDNGSIFQSVPGDGLVMQASAAISSMLLKLVEGKTLGGAG